MMAAVLSKQLINYKEQNTEYIKFYLPIICRAMNSGFFLPACPEGLFT